MRRLVLEFQLIIQGTSCVKLTDDRLSLPYEWLCEQFAADCASSIERDLRCAHHFTDLRLPTNKSWRFLAAS